MRSYCTDCQRDQASFHTYTYNVVELAEANNLEEITSVLYEFQIRGAHFEGCLDKSALIEIEGLRSVLAIANV
jgi:hypothetical protein